MEGESVIGDAESELGLRNYIRDDILETARFTVTTAYRPHDKSLQKYPENVCCLLPACVIIPP